MVMGQLLSGSGREIQVDATDPAMQAERRERGTWRCRLCCTLEVMTKVEVLTAATKLPPDEQLELAQELWENMSPPAELALTPELRELLEARRTEARANPGTSIPWSEARARILEDL
jgi:putative addiction module component (TIGR02574 family)